MHNSDLILHPVRLRIMTEVAGKQLTARQIAEALPDVPQATLYRHLKILLEGSMLEVVAETPVNGALERTYQVVRGEDRLTASDLARLSLEEHLRYFSVFAATLIDDFAEYVRRADPSQLADDGMSYNRAVIYLSDAERAALHSALINLISQYISLPPSPERKRFTLASVIIPEGKKTP